MSIKELESWLEEKQSAFLYRCLAQKENQSRQKLFEALAQAANHQATLWEKKILKAGGTLTTFRPSPRARFVALLIQRLGPHRIRPILAGMKIRGLSIYTSDSLSHETPTPNSGLERYHRSSLGGGALRAAVFGANDGLVSNASLILGMAGATADASLMILTGMAGLLAGAFSMAAGEFVSVRSQRELMEYQLDLERQELAEYPEEEAMELSLIYEAKGVSATEAKRIANTIVADPEKALETLAREELGINPRDLGSPIQAATYSLCAFSIGAFIPLLPLISGIQGDAALLTVVFSGMGLFLMGALSSLFSGRSFLFGGFRMLLIGGAAGTTTFGLGKLFGASLL